MNWSGNLSQGDTDPMHILKDIVLFCIFLFVICKLVFLYNNEAFKDAIIDNVKQFIHIPCNHHRHQHQQSSEHPNPPTRARSF